MAVELDDEVREKLKEPNFWHLATVNPDGSPHTSPVWVDVRDGRILINTAYPRKKPRNIDREPRVSLSFHDSENPYANIQIQGRVVETITGEEAYRDIDALAKKYLDRDTYPMHIDTEQRVTYLIEPTYVWHRPGRVQR